MCAGRDVWMCALFDGWLGELSSVAVDGLSRSELCDVAAGAQRLRSALDAFDTRLAAAIDALADGGAGAAATLRSAKKVSQRDADRTARRAAALAEMPRVGDALSGGAITGEHVDTLARAAAKTSPDAVEASGLLDAMKARPADVAAKDVRDWTRRHQSQTSLEETARRQRGARRVVIFEGDDGMVVLHGEFDPTTGAGVKAALDARYAVLHHHDGGRDDADTTRTPDQRRADALAELVTHAGTSGDDGGPPAVRNQLLVIAHADGTAEIPGLGPIPTHELDRLTCTSDLYGLVFTGDGQPLWHGRSKRLATDDQWRALIVRDGGCVICNAHPSRCEAHHIIFWDGPDRGPTDIENLALVCKHHHHLIHTTAVKLKRRPGGRWTLEPG